MNDEKSITLDQLFPDELTQEQAYVVLGRPKPPKLDDILPANSKLRTDSTPEEMNIEEASQFIQDNALDTNVDLNNLPEELNFAQAQDLIRKLGTQSVGVGVPEVGNYKPSGEATYGFYGPMPQLKGGRISQGFNVPVNYEKTGKHGGIDIAAAPGTPVPSVEAGEVVAVEDNGKKGFGRSVVVRNSDGSKSRYSHLNNFTVKVGQKVKAGDILGGVGNTGYVIDLGGGGYHLDYRRSK